MPKLHSYREVIKALESAGFIIRHQRGSHIKLIGPTGRIVILPRRCEIPLGTFRSILRQAGISQEEFDGLLG